MCGFKGDWGDYAGCMYISGEQPGMLVTYTEESYSYNTTITNIPRKTQRSRRQHTLSLYRVDIASW